MKAPNIEEVVTEVISNGETADGDAAAACPAGLKGGLGTLETSLPLSTTLGKGTKARSTIDGCPLGGLYGPAAGYTVLEV